MNLKNRFDSEIGITANESGRARGSSGRSVGPRLGLEILVGGSTKSEKQYEGLRNSHYGRKCIANHVQPFSLQSGYPVEVQRRIGLVLLKQLQHP